MQNTLLVTGANGFIGVDICRIATSKGYKVIGVARTGRPDIKESWVDEVQ